MLTPLNHLLSRLLIVENLAGLGLHLDLTEGAKKCGVGQAGDERFDAPDGLAPLLE